MKHTLVETFLVVETFHCVKSVFPAFGLNISPYISRLRISPYSLQHGKNDDANDDTNDALCN